MPLDEYGNEIQEEEEPQPVLPERKNKYAGLWDVPGLPTSPQVDTVTGEPLKKNKYSGIWDSAPTPPPMPPKKSPREMMELAIKAGRIPSTNIVKDLIKKYSDPEYIARVDTAEHFKKTVSNLAKSAKGLVPGLVTLADKTVGAISRPGHDIMERGMEQVAAQKAKEMGMEPQANRVGGALEPLKNMADLALWAPKLIADVIKDPIGTVENRPLDIVMLAAGGALHKGLKRTREVVAPKQPIPDVAGVIPKEQMPVIPGPGEVKGLGIEFVDDAGRPISRAEAFRGKQARIEPSAEGPGKIKMVVAPPPEVAEQPPMVRDFFEKIKEAKRLTPKQKNLYSIERRKRLARAMEAGRKIGGRAGYEAQQKALSGLLERVDFEPLKLTPEHADALFQYIEDSPAVLGFEKIATKNGLMKMLGEKGAGIPQPKELSLLKDVFGPEITTTTIGGKPWWMRAWELGIDTIGISRAAITSADLSFGLRQGIMYMARHPIKFLKDFPKQFKWFFSDKASKIVLDDIRTRENYPLAREAGLDIIGKEEPFQSRFAEKIPIIKESSRAYTTFASKMRMDAFDSRIENLQRMGINLHENLELAKKEAMLINTVTGRGQLKRLAPIQKEINAAFFSPHLALSRLNMLNPIWYIKLPKLTRIEALKYAASFASYGAVMLGLATVAGLKVGWEPTSADFLKIKIGDTRIDPFGGFSQYIRLFFQLKENKITSSTSGKVMKLGEGYKPTTRFDLLFRFGEAKEAPAFSFATGFLKGQNWIGEKFELGKETTNRFVPMVIQDFVDLYKEEPDLLPLGFLGIFGIGIQTYGPNSYKKRHGQRTSLQW